MIYRFIFFAITLLSWQINFAQTPNLVPNGSFETRVNCDPYDSYVEDAPPWFSATAATPDLFHQCAVVDTAPCPWPEQYILDPWAFGVPTNALGCESPFNGEGYAGNFYFGKNVNGYDGYKEYLGVRLSETLHAETQYTLRFYVSLPERIGNAIWNLQVYFGSDSIYQNNDTYINVNPQLSGNSGEFITNTNGWHEMAWDYTATGNESFLYIGNFQPDSQTDTLFVLEVEPQENYYLFSYYYIDDIELREGTLNSLNELSNMHFRIFPNPVSDWLIFESDDQIDDLQIFDIEGRCVKHIPDVKSERKSINVSGLRYGMYIVKALLENGLSVNSKFIKR